MTNPKKEEKREVKDPFFGLKFIAYCRAYMPPEEVETEEEDMVAYAKFYLCQKRNILFNAEVWDNYTDEEILVEYFSIRFTEDEVLRGEFETQMKGVEKADYEWFDKMTKKYEAEIEAEAKKASGGKDEFEDKF